MRATEFLLEIGYCDAAGELRVSLSDIMSTSSIIGDIEGEDVYLYQHQTQELYYFVRNDKISAFVLVVNNQLRGIWDVSNDPGQITALVAFIVRSLNKKLEIPHTEELTPNGINWLISFLNANGRGLTVTDQQGNFPNINALRKEWQTSSITKDPGPTAIFIENHIKTPLRSKDSYSLLMNTYHYLHCKDLI